MNCPARQPGSGEMWESVFLLSLVRVGEGASVSWPMAMQEQGLRYPPVRPNRQGPVPVYRTGLVGNRSKPIEVKFEFKILCANGSYRYTGRFDR